jgi:hypothetical protein
VLSVGLLIMIDYKNNGIAENAVYCD